MILREAGPLMDEVARLEPRLVPGLTSLVRAAAFLRTTIEGDWLPLEARILMDRTQVSPPGGGPGLPPEDDGGGGLPDLPLPDPEVEVPRPGDLTGGLGLNGLVGGAR